MNARIVELAKQAGIIGQSETDIAPPVEKFAELLVRDAVAHLSAVDFSDLEIDEDAGVAAGTELQYHFGINQ